MIKHINYIPHIRYVGFFAYKGDSFFGTTKDFNVKNWQKCVKEVLDVTTHINC